jgi:hypothetical protein
MNGLIAGNCAAIFNPDGLLPAVAAISFLTCHASVVGNTVAVVAADETSALSESTATSRPCRKA